MEKILKAKRRFFRKEKNIFLDTVEEKLKEYGYEYQRKSFGKIIKSINLETKCDNPDFIFIAHYDTGTITHFWYNWLVKFFGHNVLLKIFSKIVSIIHISFLLPFAILLAMFLFVNFNFIFWVLCILIFSFFIPNKNNFDDNTSGVIALLLLAKKVKGNGVDNVKFIFVDNEEKGLFGSRAHRKYLEEEQLIFFNSKIIGIDCVGKDEIPLIVKYAKSRFAEHLQREIKNEFGTCTSVKTDLPHSDAFSFADKYAALDISFVSKAVISSGYYIRKVHTSKDNEIDLNKIEKFTNALANVIKDRNAEKLKTAFSNVIKNNNLDELTNAIANAFKDKN